MNRNILVADDDIDMQVLLKYYLEQAGYAVKTCGDGYSTVDAISHNPFELLILDLNMPNLNGFSTLKRLKNKITDGELSCIVLTSSQSKDDIFNAKRFGATDYMIKPPKKQDLIERVERILGTRPQFQQVLLKELNMSEKGSFPIDIEIVSLSVNGMLIQSPIEIPNNYMIENLSVGLFDSLGICRKKFKAIKCEFDEPSGQYLYFISFVGLSPKDQENIKKWVIEKSFKNKRHPRSLAKNSSDLKNT